MANEYVVNDCGVCTNATILFSLEEKQKYVKLKYGKVLNDKWDYGYGIQLKDEGEYSPVKMERFETEEKCIEAAWEEFLIRITEKETRAEGVNKTFLARAIQELNTLRQPQQLSLF